jgi:hypothetical protein
MLFRNEGEAETGSAVTDDRATIDIERGSADAAAIKLGSAHARADTFDDQRPLQFGHRRDNDYDRATQGAIRVDRFALRQELDAEVVQFVEDLEEVLGASGQAVARPDQDNVEAMAVGVLQQAVQRRTPGFGTGDPMVGVLINDLESALTRKLT